MSGKKLRSEGYARVRAYMRRVYPGMPDKHAVGIVRRIRSRKWPTLPLKAIVDIVMIIYIRQHLMNDGPSSPEREDARDRHKPVRRLASDDLRGILRAWACGPPSAPWRNDAVSE